jgi:hypothetical protein
MKTKHPVAASLFIAFSLQGCATIMQGSTQQITVGSSPSGATVVVNGFQRLKTPAVVELSRKEPHRLEISMEGYHTETVEIRNVSSSMPMGNIIAGGLIGFAIDHSSGAAFRLVPEVVQVSLRPAVPEKQEAEAKNQTPADDPNEPVN